MVLQCMSCTGFRVMHEGYLILYTHDWIILSEVEDWRTLRVAYFRSIAGYLSGIKLASEPLA